VTCTRSATPHEGRRRLVHGLRRRRLLRREAKSEEWQAPTRTAFFRRSFVAQTSSKRAGFVACAVAGADLNRTSAPLPHATRKRRKKESTSIEPILKFCHLLRNRNRWTGSPVTLSPFPRGPPPPTHLTPAGPRFSDRHLSLDRTNGLPLRLAVLRPAGRGATSRRAGSD
jgi:hypothetical protein